MRPEDRRLACARDAALRLIAAGLLLFAQIVGAALAGASLAAPSRLELCVGTGSPAVAALPGEETPQQHRHELCPGCLACPGKTPLPSLAPVPLPGPAFRAEPRRPDPGLAPAAPERTLRPPGRAPPALS
jgi:hypothetical protein